VPCSLGVFCCFFVHSSGLPQQGQAVFLPVCQQGWPQSGRVDLRQVRCGYIENRDVVVELQRGQILVDEAGHDGQRLVCSLQ